MCFEVLSQHLLGGTEETLNAPGLAPGCCFTLFSGPVALVSARGWCYACVLPGSRIRDGNAILLIA
jgi:hypothetical protein